MLNFYVYSRGLKPYCKIGGIDKIYKSPNLVVYAFGLFWAIWASWTLRVYRKKDNENRTEKNTVLGVNKLKSDLTVKAESSSWDFGTWDGCVFGSLI